MIADIVKASTRASWLKAALATIVAAALPGCSDSSGSEPVGGVYEIAVTAATPSALPKCTSALGGTTAYVEKPSSLWSCTGGAWLQIPCANLLAGAVAYSSATKNLYACTSGQWTLVPLAQGAQGAPGATGATGPAGPQGKQGSSGKDGSNGIDGQDGADGEDGLKSLVKATPEPEGPHCAIAGQRIDIGLDINGDGSLEPNEIQQTAYVCGGTSSTTDDGGTPAADTDQIVPLSAGPVVAPPHDFGSQLVGTLSPALNVTLSNATAATIDGIAAITGGAPYFVTNSSCNSLAPGASCTLSVRFSPTSPGTYPSNLFVRGSDGASSTKIIATVELSGIGLSPANLLLAPGGASFGAVLLGFSSPAFPFTVTNSGQTSTGPLAVKVQPSASYVLESGADGCTGKSLDAGKTCLLGVRFAPAVVGLTPGNLTVSGPSGSTTVATLTGTGRPLGSLFVTPSYFDFGTRLASGPAPKTTFAVVNSNGAASATVNVSVAGDFMVTGGSCGAVLAPGQSCSVDVAFVASTAGVRQGVLQVDPSAYADLKGTVVP